MGDAQPIAALAPRTDLVELLRDLLAAPRGDRARRAGDAAVEPGEIVLTCDRAD
jgi:hypothetical protein